MDAALIGPLAAPPAPHVGEAAGAVAASDAPAFAAALASADQTLHDAPTPDVDPVAPSDVATEEATESSLPANDAVTLTQQCLADMAAMLASLNATPTPTSPPVVAVVSALPETSTTDVDAGPQSSIEAGVEDLLTERDRAAALHDRVVRLRHESGEPTPPSAVPDAATAATADTADIATTANPASAAPVAPSANTTSTATGASPPAIPSAGPSASPPVAASASPSQSLVASVTAALSAPAVSVPSPGGQGVAAREPGARGRVASAAAAPTAATARVAAPSDPIGGDASAATQHSQNISTSTSTSTPPPQFNGLSAPASAGVNVSGNLSGARMSGEPAFQAQLSAQLFSSDFAPALGVQISTLTRNGIPEARLHLNPAELGPIAVQIELDGRTAQIVLSASHAETRLVLEQAMPQLASAMREAGFSMSGGGVFQQPQQREQRASDGTPKRAGSGVDAGLAPATMTLARVQHGVLDVYA